jgi:CubicO group peptidase (beta-lactamase class C family)
MLCEHSFGYDGAGGQLAFADETYRVGFAYLSSQMGPVLRPRFACFRVRHDQRANELTRALRACLAAP